MRAENNLYPYVSMAETAAPANPAAGDRRLFVDPADHLLKLIDSAGLVTPVAAAPVTTTRGDLITRGIAADGRLALGAAHTLLQSDGTDPVYGKLVPANVDLTASAGLVPTLSGSALDFLNGLGAWAVPAGGGGGGGFTDPMIAAGDLIYMGGGADLARAYTAIIGDSGQSGNAVNLYDGDDSSYFTSNAEAVANIWTGVDVGSAQAIAAFRLVLYGTTGFAAVPVGGTLLVESSPDNATWTVETTYIVTGADSGILATSGSARFWRVRCPANTGTRFGARTFSLLSAVVPTRLPRGTGGQVLTIDATTLLPKWA